MLHCDPPEAKRVTYIQITSTNSRWFSPGLKHPLSVSGSNGFGDNIPPEVHLFSSANQDLVGKAAYARVGSGRARVLPLTSCLYLAAGSPYVARRHPPTACHHSSIHLSFPEALSALVTSTMGNAGGTLSGVKAVNNKE